MKLSVIILNYNVRFFLEQCILSVQRSLKTIDAEIIVVDNNSSDGSCQMVKELFPEITLLENKVNHGFSKANNQAVKIAKGAYVCILNPDTAVAEDTFIEALNYIKPIDNLGALGIYLMDGKGLFLPESKRNLPTPKASLLKLIGWKTSYYATEIEPLESGQVPVLVGAFMLIKKTVYQEVGGFDEDYFMYGEDIDLSFKLTKAGYRNYYLGTTSILHYKGESTKKDAAYFDRFYGAMFIFYQKHFKSNMGVNSLVKIGVFLAKRIKRSSRSTEHKRSKNQKTYLFTKDLVLTKRLSEKLKTKIQPVTTDVFSDEELANCCFIFDADEMTYSQIFTIMKSLSGFNNKFRIKPPGCNFILGSDQSDENGAALVF